MGNTVVLKPATYTRLTALLLRSVQRLDYLLVRDHVTVM